MGHPALIASFHTEGQSWRGMKNEPRGVRTKKDSELPWMHLIGVVDIPRIHGVQLVGVGLQNDPILLSGTYRDAGHVGPCHQRTAGAEDRQGGESPRLQRFAGHSVVVEPETEDSAIRCSLRIAHADRDFRDGVIGVRREAAAIHC